jgi:membrane protein DedA with SNARE-associated domain
VLAAAAFEMNFWHFLLAIFSGRFVRFLALSLLTIKFGPQFVEWSGRFVGQNIFWILGGALEILAIWWLVRRVKSRRKSSNGPTTSVG